MKLFNYRQLSDHLDGTSNPPLAVDHLAAFVRSHAGAEADVAGSFDLAGLMGVMHGLVPSTITFAATFTFPQQGL